MQNFTLSNRIKETCKKKHITMQSLLIACEMNRNTIYDLEKREVYFGCDKLLRIADYLDVSVDYLLGRTDNENSHKEK